MSDGKEWATLSPEEFTQLQKYIDCESFSFFLYTNRLLLAPNRNRGKQAPCGGRIREN